MNPFAPARLLLAALLAATALACMQASLLFSADADTGTADVKSAPPADKPAAKARRARVVPVLTEEEALQVLERDLSRHVGKQIQEADFPEEARRWSWSGTTVVLVSMASDGSMKDVSVRRSSGFRLLDQRALQIVRRVTVPPVPERLRGREVAVTVPVGFYIGQH